MESVGGFLLTRDWRDTPKGIELRFWAASASGPFEIVIPGQEAVCFVETAQLADFERLATGLGLARQSWRHREVALATPDGAPVHALYFRAQRDLATVRSRARDARVRLYESDLKPSDRYLMERFVSGGIRAHCEQPPTSERPRLTNARIVPERIDVELRVLSLDVESSDLDGDLYSVALAGENVEHVLLLDPGAEHAQRDPFVIESFESERELLEGLLRTIDALDPDVIIGWNVIGFDLAYLERRCARHGLRFALGRGRQVARVLPGQGAGQIPIARVPGRVVLDGIETLRAAFWSFEDFSLEAVARTMLGRGKLVHEDSPAQIEAIRELFAHDKGRLADYNLEDCRLVLAIFAAADLVAFARERAEITGLAFGRTGGSVAAFDHLYLPRLHRKGRVAPDAGESGRARGTGSPGGYVLDSQPGLYRNVLVLDFKSLYPSIIRTFQIDPYGLWVPGDDPVEGFLEASFSRTDGILPEVMGELWSRRDAAKQERNAPLSQAVKIIMNACYGVLAATSCRFFDPRLATSITRRGHEIITRSRERVEEHGHRVIYGDTDSLFVLLDQDLDEPEARATGTTLAAELNRWWTDTMTREHQVRSCLEVEFETHFLRFLMPTIRGADTGTKKRYAGMIRGPDGSTDLVFKGLETVRTDWTPLARGFQRELYRRVFNDEPIDEFVSATDQRLLAGELDDQLIYRKRIRRPLSEYQKNVPPHVQAARKQAHPGRWVNYIITRDGPEPIENERAVPDYEHYRSRQLAPAADGILRFLDTSFARLTDAQMDIF